MPSKSFTSPAAPGLFDLDDDFASDPGLSAAQKSSRKRKDLVLQQPMQSIAIRPLDRGSLTRNDLLLWLRIVQEIQQMDTARSYSIPLKPIMDFLSNKRNYDRLRPQLATLNRTQVEWNNSISKDKEVWGVSTLISRAVITRDGDTATLEIELPSNVDKGVREMSQFSALNLLLAREMKSTAALNLYRIAIGYATNPSHLTFTRTITEWDEILRGQARDPAKELVYKYMKRDMLLPAIKEVEEMTHLIIELLEHHEGGARAVTHLQFHVTTKPIAIQKIQDPNVTLAKSALKSLGLRADEISSLIGTHGAEQVLRNVDYAQKEQEKGKVRMMRAYIKKAVADDYAQQGDVIEAESVKPKKRVPNLADKLLAQFKVSRVEDAERMFAEMTRKQSEATWQQFQDLETHDAALKRAIKSKGLESARVKTVFFEWLATETWGPVNNDTLIEFMREHSDKLQ